MAVLAGFPSWGAQAADTSVYRDPETGFTFSQFNAAYQIGNSIAIRIAVPSPVAANTPYDAVIQIVAPNAVVGWTGLAWGGTMLSNPLTLFWEYNSKPLVSSRYTNTRVMPPAWTGASLTVFKTGTKTNGTHWQFTAKCTGCTSFTGSSNSNTVLTPTGVNRLAFAYATARPSNPSSNTSSIGPHDVYNYWNHDFASAGNTAFASLVAKNL